MQKGLCSSRNEWSEQSIFRPTVPALRPFETTAYCREGMCHQDMTDSLKTGIARQGYAFFRQNAARTNVIALANAPGRPVPWKGGLVQVLRARATAAPNTYSGIYGLQHFPFHTDLAHWSQPPRYFLLRCAQGYADVPTLLLDGNVIIEAVMKDILSRAIFRPRSPRQGVLPALRLFESTEQAIVFAGMQCS
jgi:L-asparagine oxygenase